MGYSIAAILASRDGLICLEIQGDHSAICRHGNVEIRQEEYSRKE